VDQALTPGFDLGDGEHRAVIWLARSRRDGEVSFMPDNQA
jgi:hypothetical protein